MQTTATKTEIHIYQSGDYTVSKSGHHHGMWNVYHNQTGHGHALTIADEATRVLYPLTVVGVDKQRKYREFIPGPKQEAPMSAAARAEYKMVTVVKGTKKISGTAEVGFKRFKIMAEDDATLFNGPDYINHQNEDMLLRLGKIEEEKEKSAIDPLLYHAKQTLEVLKESYAWQLAFLPAGFKYSSIAHAYLHKIRDTIARAERKAPILVTSEALIKAKELQTLI